MRPSFNTAGPCFPDEHYMIPPERRLGRAMELIEDGKYFTLTAGRQTGKTTSLNYLVERYNAGDRFRAINVDLQSGADLPTPSEAFAVVLESIVQAVERDCPEIPRPSEGQHEEWLTIPATAVRNMLSTLAAASKRPLVVLFDEADGLVGSAMVSFLKQLRTGYIARRKAAFPHSIVLAGMRKVRDYVVSAKTQSSLTWLGTTSPFNITAEALTLSTFTREEVDELLAQHTKVTGQRFEPEAAAMIFDLSKGHPWLVNALADQIVDRDVRDRSVPITAAHVQSAKETIILERRTHIDSLIAKLHEPRVRRILDPMLAGERTPDDTLDDDFAYVLGLGLLRRGTWGFEIANPIYREVIPRALTYIQQNQIQVRDSRFVQPDGSLDMPELMRAFQIFWREDGHVAAAGFDYRESGPHLMFMAFLQRILNGGGRLVREYALGKGALDLLIEWKGQRTAVEVKLRRHTQTEERALEQVAEYLEILGLAEGWLLMFDLRKKVSWGKKLFFKKKKRAGKVIHFVGC